MTTTGRVVAMASYPDYNPSVWTGGISQREFNELFGTPDGEPILNWVTQGEYAPGSTFKVTSTAAAVADGYPLDGMYNCPASVNIDGADVQERRRAQPRRHAFAEALIQSCDTVYYELGYHMYQSDDPKANTRPARKPRSRRCRRWSWTGGSASDTGIDLPGRVDRHHPYPAVAVLPVEGQRAHRPGLVQVRQGRTALTSSRSSTRTARTAGSLGTGPGRHRRDRPGLRDRHPAPAGQRLRRAGQRRHAVQPADRRGAGLAPPGRSCRRSTRR